MCVPWVMHFSNPTSRSEPRHVVPILDLQPTPHAAVSGVLPLLAARALLSCHVLLQVSLLNHNRPQVHESNNTRYLSNSTSRYLSMSAVYILGAGSIGTLFAHHIAASGIPCTLLLRTADHLRTLRSLDNMITVEERAAGGTYAVRKQRVQAEMTTSGCLQQQPSSSIDVRPAAHIQQLVLTTKASHAIPALAAVKHRLNKDSVVVLLQNGVLGVYVEAVQQLFCDSSSRPTFLLGSTTHGAYRRSPFHVVHGSSGQGTCVFGLPSEQLQSMALGPATPHHQMQTVSNTAQCKTGCEHDKTCVTAGQQATSQQDQTVKDMLDVLSSLHALHPDTALSPDELHQQLLLKLLVNCCANPLSALLHCKNGGLTDSTHTEVIWRRVISECKRVFEDMLLGDEEQLYKRVHHVVKINSTNYNSMLQDVVHKLATEVDYLNGFVVKQGARLGIVTPVNELLTTLVKAREDVPPQFLTRESL